MSKNLFSASNAIRTEKDLTVSKLLKEHSALTRQNMLASGLAGFLAIVSALSINSCRSNAKALDATHSENVALTQTVAHFQKDTENLAKEKNKLEAYKTFVHSIDGFYPEKMIDNRSDEEANNMHQESIQMQKKYDDACKTLGINPVELSRLKEME